jgi:phospholipid transport system substrate-binding protein
MQSVSRNSQSWIPIQDESRKRIRCGCRELAPTVGAVQSMSQYPAQRRSRPGLLAAILVPCIFVAAPSRSADSESAASPDSKISTPAPNPGTPPRQMGATTTVDELHGVFLEVMKSAKKIGFEGRLERIAEIVHATFDLEFMALKVLGPGRKKLGAGETKRWIESFSGLLLSNYARRFVGWSGQAFESLSEEPAPRDTIVVQSRLTRPEDSDIELDYRLRKTQEGWRIIDIYSNGNVSELALRRSEFADIFKNDGIEKLIASVDKQAAQR